MDQRIINYNGSGAVAIGSKDGEKVNLWTERIIVCLKCGWQGTETSECPRCGIPLSNYSSVTIPV